MYSMSTKAQFIVMAAVAIVMLVLPGLIDCTEGWSRLLLQTIFLVIFGSIFTMCSLGWYGTEVCAIVSILLIALGIIAVPSKMLLAHPYIGSFLIPAAIVYFSIIASTTLLKRISHRVANNNYALKATIVSILFVYFVSVLIAYYGISYIKVCSMYDAESSSQGLYYSQTNSINHSLIGCMYYSCTTYFNTNYSHLVPRGSVLKIFALGEVVMANIVYILLIPIALIVITTNRLQSGINNNDIYKDMLDDMQEKIERGRNIISERRRQWPECADRILNIFNTLCAHPNVKNLGRLYVDDSRNDQQLHQGLGRVSILWGMRSLGVGTIENPKEIAQETGATLSFSQGARGEVLCVIFPFGSQLHNSQEKFLVIDIYERPSQIAVDDIQRAIRIFFAYSVTTSLFGVPTLLDRIAIFRLRVENYYISRNRTELIVNNLKIVEGILSAVVKKAFGI